MNNGEKLKKFKDIGYGKRCFIIGNSSSGIREACVYGKASIDLGNRQKGRYDEKVSNIIHSSEQKDKILEAINSSAYLEIEAESYFGTGDSDEKFINIILNNDIWDSNIQKKFIDINF